MLFYSAFPTSPLSRSALASERVVESGTSSRTSSKPSKAYGSIASSSASPMAPRRPITGFTPFDDQVGSTLQSPFAAHYPASPASRHVSGPARLMRSPLASSSPSFGGTPFDDGDAVSPPLPSSSFTRSVNTRRRSSGFGISATSPTPNFGSLVGSFQESLLRGRMSMPASKPVIFDAEIGVLGVGKCRPSLRCPPHLHVKFPAHFYDFHAIDASSSAPNAGSTAALGSPYVGTIDLEAHYHDMLLDRKLAALGLDASLPHGSQNAESAGSGELPPFPGYAVPPKGQIQLIVKYPDLNAVKLFLVPYDLTDMQPGTKTFVRQKSMLQPSSTGSVNNESQPGSRSSPVTARQPTKVALRFAIHLQFCCPPVETRADTYQAGFEGSAPTRFRHHSEAGQHGTKKSSVKSAKSPKIFLHKSIRLVFGARALDSGEKLIDHIETPGQGAQRFSSYHGPDEEWHQLHHEVKAIRRSIDGSQSASFSDSGIVDRSTDMRLTGSGLGIDIQTSVSHTTRSAPHEDDIQHNVEPLNSDPNGERWQPAAPQADTNPNVVEPAIPSAAAWSLSSHDSSFGIPSGRWPESARNSEQDAVQQIARSLASSRLSEAFRSGQAAEAPAHEQEVRTSTASAPFSTARRATVGSRAEPTDEMTLLADSLRAASSACSIQRSRSPMLPPQRPSRIRSASTASLSEARVQNVSALGRLEEATSTPARTDSASIDSPFSRRPARVSKKVGADRPSLLRKLSEQFARSHTPSPTASPKLRPTWRQVGDESADFAINDPDGNASEGSEGDEASLQRSTGSIR